MYKKIDIHVGPNLVRARLLEKVVCTCGKEAITSPLGTEYQIDTRSVRWAKYTCFGCGKVTPVRLVDTWNELLIPRWTFLDALDAGRKIPIVAKPDNWTQVQDNLVAPAHYTTGRIQ